MLYAGVCKLLGYSIGTKDDTRYRIATAVTGHEGETMPDISLLLQDGVTYINIASIPLGKPTVLFYFGPDCPYCQSEVQEIIQNINELRDIHFFLISPYSQVQIRKFYERYKLNRYQNIVVGMDYKYKFADYFKTQTIPYLAIYSKKKVLRASFLGVVDSQQIRSASEK